MAVATSRDARTGLPDWAWGILVMVGIVLLSRLSDIASFTGLPIKPWKPGAGFAFGMLLVRGLHLLPWVLLGQASAVLAASLAADLPPDWGASIAAGFSASLGLGIAADYLRRRTRVDLALSRLGDVLRLLVVAIALAPAISALEVLAFVSIGPLREAEAQVGFLRLCIGNLIGMAVVTPIVLRLHAPGLSRLRAVGGVAVLEIAALCGALLVLAWYIFGIKETDEFKLFDLLFLPMVAFAVRYGLDGALAGLALTQVAMMGWLRWQDFPAAGVVELQTLFFILSATCIFVGIVVDERERAGAALRANEKLLREQDAQLARVMRLDAIGEMASTLSHEITQPLTAVRAHLRAALRRLEAGATGIEAATTDLRHGVTQVDLAAGIIRRLREFLGRGEPHREAIDPLALVRDALALAAPDAERGGVRVVLHAPALLPAVLVDRIQMQQVLLNLLRNAVEASRAGDGARLVSVGLRASDGEAIEVSVHDDGPGIAEEIRPRLFAAFATTRPHGLGLGLAISRTIVEAHGGRIWLERPGPDGTEFRFTLPLARPA